MNKIPILSEQEKKKTFAAKKKQKVVLKNLLVQPFERYWPELTTEDVQDFVETFGNYYKLKSSDKICTNTATLAESHQNDDNKTPHTIPNKLKLKIGLQASIRCISSGQRLALFISSKIRPKYIVDQIIAMALTQNQNSTIFCVPMMDEALSEVLGFSCQCLAVLENESDVWSWSMNKSKQFPLPEQFKSVKPTKVERMEVDSPTIVEHENIKVDFTKIYLRKENPNERAFAPLGSISNSSLGTSNINDFISLGETSHKIDKIRLTHQLISKIHKMEKPVAKTCSKLENLMLPDRFSMKKKNQGKHNHNFHGNKHNYVSLKINRVQPNPEKNRIKNKKKNKK